MNVDIEIRDGDLMIDGEDSSLDLFFTEGRGYTLDDGNLFHQFEPEFLASVNEALVAHNIKEGFLAAPIESDNRQTRYDEVVTLTSRLLMDILPQIDKDKIKDPAGYERLLTILTEHRGTQ